MSFDEQPDGDPHGECAAEIHRLEIENAAMKTERDKANTKWHRAINLAMEAEDRETRLATALIRAEKEREIAMAENAALRAKLDAAQKDAERMDWIDTLSSSGLASVGNGDYSYYVHGEGYPKVREVIDKARADERK